MTDYLVFELYEGDARPVGQSRASSAEQAIRAVIVDRKDTRSDTFVAVPARSWKPVRVTTETRTVLKLQADLPPAEAPP